MTGMEETAHLLLSHWGKARGDEAEGGPGWHPLVYHCLDVAAVGRAWLEAHPGWAHATAAQLGWPVEDLRRWVVTGLILHDVGKLAPAFQAKRADLAPVAVTNSPVRDGSGDHVRDGMALLDLLIEGSRALRNLGRDQAPAMLAPMIAHHGRPADRPDQDPDLEDTHPLKRLVLELIRLAESIAGVTAPLPRASYRAVQRASWRLAGLAVLADWVGSNSTWFPFHSPSVSPETYWEERARPQAERALAEACLMPARVAQATGWPTLMGSDWTPTALQDWAATVALPDGPVLALLEDMTGSGKTEAALMLSWRLMASGRGQGVFFGLPTQATANALYARIGALYQRLFDSGPLPTLTLAHGARRHVDARWGTPLGPQAERAAAFGDDSALDRRAWIEDSTRKCFLASVGVGTIDQALLAVLRAKHQGLRLFGLSNRVLVVDEAHALADGYMQAELDRLVEFQAALGGATVILSATLTIGRRQALLDAFGRGTVHSSPVVDDSRFPLAVLAGAGSAVATPVAHRRVMERRLQVRRLDDAQAALHRIEQAAGTGAAVAWIRNTVDDAIAAYRAVRALGLAASLFHARFIRADRARIEAQAVARFGKHGDPAKRGHVLIATQVIEQSLDVDFDCLITDLAPVDLLLQRAGRLWRHPDRSRPLPGPRLDVVSPRAVADPDATWLQATQPGSSIVYGDDALMWASARVVFAQEAWQLPQDQRRLLEQVDALCADPDAVPESLQTARLKAEGKEMAGRSTAASTLLSLDRGYGGNVDGWDQDTRAPTRLGEPQVTLRLAWHDPASKRLSPLPQAEGDWALSQVQVRQSRVGRAEAPSDLEALVAATRQTFGSLDQDATVVVMARIAGTDDWRSRSLLFDGEGQAVELHYSSDAGAVFSVPNADDAAMPERP